MPTAQTFPAALGLAIIPYSLNRLRKRRNTTNPAATTSTRRYWAGIRGANQPKGHDGAVSATNPDQHRRSQVRAEASSFLSEGENGVKRPPFDGKLEAGSA